MRSLPDSFAFALSLKVSIDRLTKFISTPELKLEYIQKNNVDEDTAIKVQNGNFYWLSEEEKKIKKEAEAAEKGEEAPKAEEEKKQEEPEELDKQPLDSVAEIKEEEKVPIKYVLKDINLHVKKKSFVAVLGEYD